MVRVAQFWKVVKEHWVYWSQSSQRSVLIFFVLHVRLILLMCLLFVHRSPVRVPTPPSRTRMWEVGRFRLTHTNSPSVSRTTATLLIKTLSCEVFKPQFKVTFIFSLLGALAHISRFGLTMFFTGAFLTAPFNWLCLLHECVARIIIYYHYLLSFSFNMFCFSWSILLHFASHGYSTTCI